MVPCLRGGCSTCCHCGRGWELGRGACCVISVQFNPILQQQQLLSSQTASCSCNFIKIRQRTNTPLASVSCVCIPASLYSACLCPSLGLSALLCAPCRLIAAPKWRRTLSHKTLVKQRPKSIMRLALHFLSMQSCPPPSCLSPFVSTYEYAENCNWRKKDVSGY